MKESSCHLFRITKVQSPWRRAPIIALMLALSAGGVLALQTAGPSRWVVERQSDGSVVTTTNQLLMPTGRQVEFQGRPLAVAVSPDGHTAAFLNGGYQAAIILVDVDSWTVKQEFTAAGGSASFDGILYAPDGSKLYASQSTGRVLSPMWRRTAPSV